MDADGLLIATIASSLATAMAVFVAVRSWLRTRSEPPGLAGGDDNDEDTRPFSDEDVAMAASGPADIRFKSLARLMRPNTLEELSFLRRRLARAGLRSQEAVDLFSVGRAISTMVGAALCLLLITFGGAEAGTWFFASLLLAAGFFAPQLWLKVRITARQEALANSLPPTLDLLVTCMEAGLALEQAMDRVAREIGFSDPEMAEELSVVIAEMRAGLSVGEAFRKLADRVTADEVRNLSNVIIQSATLGAALGRTLREYAASARRRRVLALEEIAGKVTARLTLPLTLCLLPSAIIAMLGPAVVIVYRTLFD